jgi:hypothetical protein
VAIQVQDLLQTTHSFLCDRMRKTKRNKKGAKPAVEPPPRDSVAPPGLEHVVREYKRAAYCVWVREGSLYTAAKIINAAGAEAFAADDKIYNNAPKRVWEKACVEWKRSLMILTGTWINHGKWTPTAVLHNLPQRLSHFG